MPTRMIASRAVFTGARPAIAAELARRSSRPVRAASNSTKCAASFSDQSGRTTSDGQARHRRGQRVEALRGLHEGGGVDHVAAGAAATHSSETIGGRPASPAVRLQPRARRALQRVIDRERGAGPGESRRPRLRRRATRTDRPAAGPAAGTRWRTDTGCRSRCSARRRPAGGRRGRCAASRPRRRCRARRGCARAPPTARRGPGPARRRPAARAAAPSAPAAGRRRRGRRSSGRSAGKVPSGAIRRSWIAA